MIFISDEDMNSPLALYECSLVIQGEGKYVGIPHILIRTLGCQLRCRWCDSWYTSWTPEKPENRITYNTIIDIYKTNPQIRYTMITGGGPTLQANLLKELCRIAKQFGHFVTIETEGSQFVQTEADFISLSPKFKNSTPTANEIHPYTNKVILQKEVDQHEKNRCNYEAMYKMIFNHSDFQIKPVISTEDQIDELEELYELLWNEHGFNLDNDIGRFGSDYNNKNDFIELLRSNTYCMPEGIVEEELKRNRQWLIKECIKRGYNYTDRLHIVAFGNIRGV